MNTMRIMLAGAVSALLSWPAAGWAEQASDQQPSEENPAVTQQEEQLDGQAANPEGERQVVERLTKEFSIDEAKITELRDKRLGYGEIDHLLSLAKQMPDGITDANVNQILQMRQDQHMGWGNISKTLLNKNLGSAITGQPSATSSAQPATSGGASAQPQGLTRPGRSAGSDRARGHGINTPSAGTGGFQHTGRPSGFEGGHSGGNAAGRGAQPSFGEAGGRSSSAPGHNR